MNDRKYDLVGRRDLSQQERSLVKRIKALEVEAASLQEELKQVLCQQRLELETLPASVKGVAVTASQAAKPRYWLGRAGLMLEDGFTAMLRSIQQPTS